ncbi:hypothetical protein BV25DRAFT_1994945 [Artomyces pyxidatus]|uniref:Uncharacterized protein n=1 Tax=Artomyces pyxidatus TaxID=48021 RepID=A0ACB8SMG6_9AGAM|nr:hypothetical protein BV25DRAFT_1994945 [Artomyces pyxidatus]
MPLRHRGLEVWLGTDATEINHYQEEVVDETTITCYVPSEVGKQFDVRFRGIAVDMAFVVFMDGRRMQSMLCPRSHNGQLSVMKGYYPTLSTCRPFRFSQLELTDDDSARSDLDVAKLGVIEVAACRVQVLESMGYYNAAAATANVGPVSEKAKKMGGHSVSLGEDEKLETSLKAPSKVIWIDQDSAPYAKFCFRYQPKDLLQAKGIIPRLYQLPDEQVQVAEGSSRPARGKKRAASPTNNQGATRVKHESNSATQARMRALRAELESLESGGVKREGSPIRLSVDDDDVIDLTLERSPSPIRVGESSGETIDLTDD